jgi:glycoprotein 3-alpha-L-fucosyltransferase
MLALNVQQQSFQPWIRLVEPADSVVVGNNGAYEQVNSKELPADDQEPLLLADVESSEGSSNASSSSSASALRRHGLPWYIKNDGGHRPDEPMTNIWPTRNNGDRIEEQLMIAPRYLVNDPASLNDAPVKKVAPLKKIFLPNGLNAWQVKGGQKLFLEQKCPVDRCALTAKRDDAATADAILYKGKKIKK